MVKFKKSLAIVLSSSFFLTSINTNQKLYAQDIENSIYQDQLDTSFLMEEKIIEFNALINEFNLSQEEQLKLLNDYKDIHSEKIEEKWGMQVIKKAAKYAVELIGAKVAEKRIADWVDYVFEYQDRIQIAMEEACIKYFNASENTTHWVAKTLMLMFF